MDRTALQPGARLGEFEIVRVLASGGFGIVYLARDRSLDRDVAVKEFMPSSLAGRGNGQRVSVRSAADASTYTLGLQSFIEEAKLLARLSHPAIVKVYRFWKANGTGYMVMPYLRGPTLGNVRRSMSVPPTETWLRHITAALLDALDVMHSEGFYHRDIAPDNVLVGENGLPVLLDFGAARRVIANRTQSVTAIVKPHFAPIEQYAETRTLKQGPWTDLYALGALVSYLVEGVPPPASTARALHDERAPLARRHIPGVSTAFLAAIDWALAVRPQDRPQSIAELRSAFDGRLAQPLSRTGSGRPPHHGAAVGTWSTDTQFPATRRLTPASDDAADTFADLDADRSTPQLARGLPVRFDRRARALVATAIAAAAALMVVAAQPTVDGAVASPVTVSAAPPISAPFATPFAASLVAPVALSVAAPVAERVAVPLTSVTSMADLPPLNPPIHLARTTPVHPYAMSNASKKKAANAHRHPPDRRLASSKAHSPGPMELCAGHNFFMRAWCMQRRCDEPKFKGNAQCTPHQVARSIY